MDDLGTFFMLIDEGMEMGFTVYGYYVTFKDIFLWSGFSTLIAWAIARYINDNT